MTNKRMPPINLKAAGSKINIPLDKLGVPTVLLFLWQETEVLGYKVRDAVREKYPEPSQVLIINLADLRGLPKMMRGMAERGLAKGYKKMVNELPDGVRAHEHVIILPDWKGEVVDAVGAGDTHKTPAVAVMDAEGEIIGLYHGDDLATAAMDFLKNVFSNEDK